MPTGSLKAIQVLERLKSLAVRRIFPSAVVFELLEEKELAVLTEIWDPTWKEPSKDELTNKNKK